MIQLAWDYQLDMKNHLGAVLIFANYTYTTRVSMEVNNELGKLVYNHL